tara:strand:- start:91 stop:483 length:393 start_codon:yes stop_codon:yes gene_type:complete
VKQQPNGVNNEKQRQDNRRDCLSFGDGRYCFFLQSWGDVMAAKTTAHPLARVFLDATPWQQIDLHIDSGVLVAYLWLNEDKYEAAVKALNDAEWHCTHHTDVSSRWRAVAQATQTQVVLQKSNKDRKHHE